MFRTGTVIDRFFCKRISLECKDIKIAGRDILKAMFIYVDGKNPSESEVWQLYVAIKYTLETIHGANFFIFQLLICVFWEKKYFILKQDEASIVGVGEFCHVYVKILIRNSTTYYTLFINSFFYFSISSLLYTALVRDSDWLHHQYGKICLLVWTTTFPSH